MKGKKSLAILAFTGAFTLAALNYVCNMGPIREANNDLKEAKKIMVEERGAKRWSDLDSITLDLEGTYSFVRRSDTGSTEYTQQQVKKNLEQIERYKTFADTNYDDLPSNFLKNNKANTLNSRY